MENEMMGYVFCIVMTVALFAVIWGLSKLLSIATDKILPDPDNDWDGQS